MVEIELKRCTEMGRAIGTIRRVPRQHAGWQSVVYKGERYILRGGIRGPEFINLDNPIKRRAR